MHCSTYWRGRSCVASNATPETRRMISALAAVFMENLPPGRKYDTPARAGQSAHSHGPFSRNAANAPREAIKNADSFYSNE